MGDGPYTTRILELTAQVVAAYVSNNSVSIASVSSVVAEVHESFAALKKDRVSTEEGAAALRPAVPVKRSVQEDFIICLEDGKKFKSLKRYLRTRYSLTPEQYRAKWRLPSDYPMVAPNYARTRSDLAKTMKLGHKPGHAAAR